MKYNMYSRSAATSLPINRTVNIMEKTAWKVYIPIYAYACINSAVTIISVKKDITWLVSQYTDI